MKFVRFFQLVICFGVLAGQHAFAFNRTNGDVVEDSMMELECRLNEYVAKKDARIGVAVIFNGEDTVLINGVKEFPIQSVFKFPLALVVGEFLIDNKLTLSDTLSVDFDALIKDTYSPMLKKYEGGVQQLTFKELMEWSLMESDNNAADILLKVVGGPDGMMQVMKEIGVPESIVVGASEEDMHRDNYASYLNRSTPLDMARLFDDFDVRLKNQSPIFKCIAEMMEKCRTGVDRLPAPFKDGEVLMGHKTGTGFIMPDGRLSSLNDCGYVRFMDGTRYSIAIFVADSAYDFAETAKIIAEISAIVSEYRK